jgi:hypothetical protein
VVFEKDMIGLELVQSHSAFVRSIGVTIVTELGENRLNVLAKLSHAGNLSGP